MAVQAEEPSRWPKRGYKRGRASPEGCVGSRARRLCHSVTGLLVNGCLLLLAPATEVGVSPKDHLEHRINDMIRCALDERRVLFDGYGDWLLQLVFALHHLWWFVNDRHEFSFLSSFSLA